ncbi:MAG: site-specific DNA-methyltransferase [Deltaproteobacteria bacterium HGW-Deltaproteobacteria-13]|jgi:site-specific DNA-methyltransferase (adenine-specific)|nr:MAG: site-specific DNA-methyltransferase [Deltaproteobacteria bacterium HGW-Deltaproteobacteria-13]
MKPFLSTQHGVLFDRDCLKVMSIMRSETIDCVFADPPFNLGKDYKNGFNDKVAAVEYFEWCRQWINECSRLLKPGGAFFLYGTPELAIQFASVMNQRLTFRHWIAITMKGTYSRGKKLYPAHYALLYYTRGEPRIFNKVRIPIPVCRHCGKEIKDYGGHRNKLNPAGLNLTDFWDDTSPNRHKRYKVRPGVNELKLMIPERAILISTEPGDLVFDPFGGGGTTFQAAEANHRNWIGTELFDCNYIECRLNEKFPLSCRRKPMFNYERIFEKYEDHKNEILQWVQR